MSRASEVVSQSPEDTIGLGQRLGELLRGGDFVALYGPLGAGKTQLVKGLAAGLGVPEGEPIVSPTFVLVREYMGRLKLYHIDAYRLSGPAEMLSLGLPEMTGEPDAVVAIEWADRTADAVPPGACRIELSHVGPSARHVRIEWADEARLAVLKHS